MDSVDICNELSTVFDDKEVAQQQQQNGNSKNEVVNVVVHSEHHLGVLKDFKMHSDVSVNNNNVLKDCHLSTTKSFENNRGANSSNCNKSTSPTTYYKKQKRKSKVSMLIHRHTL